jgi:hypothetical protein
MKSSQIKISTIYPSEHQEQVALMQSLALLYPEIYELTAAIPNGGHRHIATARKLKREGVSAGYPDILIDYPCKGKHGMRIELKRVKAAKPRLTPEQKHWLDKLSRQGYLAIPAYGCADALQQIKQYIAL